MAIPPPPFGAIGDFEAAQSFGRKNRAMGHRADEPRRAVIEKEFAHFGADAVGSDHDVGVDGFAVCKVERITTLRFFHICKLMVEGDRRRRDHLRHDVVMVAPVSQARLTKHSGLMPVRISSSSTPRSRSTFIALALRMMPAPMREKVDACS